MSTKAAIKAPAPALLLLVWAHGFKGNDDTFGEFPDRVKFLCGETWPETRCESLVYPAYDTRGALGKAVDLFIDWLTIKTAEREAVLAEELKYDGKGDGHREHAYIILLGHSMGGLVIADAALNILRSRPSGSDTPLWPHIIGVIGYDTPYYGLNPGVFANTATEAYGHAVTAHNAYTKISAGLGVLGVGTALSGDKGAGRAPPNAKKITAPPAAGGAGGGGWWKYGVAAAGVAAAAAGAAGAAYWQKDRITENVTWATSHLDFVGELWKKEAMLARVKEVLGAQDDLSFFCFYTAIPGANPKDKKLFIIPPKDAHPDAVRHFGPNDNGKARNEIDAHIKMFTSASTGFYALGDSSATLINDWLSDAHRKRLVRKTKEAACRAQRRASVDAAATSGAADDGAEGLLGKGRLRAESEVEQVERERKERSDAKGKAAERAKQRFEKEIIDLTLDDEPGVAPAEVPLPDDTATATAPPAAAEHNPW